MHVSGYTPPPQICVLIFVLPVASFILRNQISSSMVIPLNLGGLSVNLVITRSLISVAQACRLSVIPPAFPMACMVLVDAAGDAQGVRTPRAPERVLDSPVTALLVACGKTDKSGDEARGTASPSCWPGPLFGDTFGRLGVWGALLMVVELRLGVSVVD
ncbi:hypothetical protein QBC35DRAFT_188964 [Podospora australis]|uniref:Uncharacterized protein n=1 Tax=Podospora australis TaxID=1536484 RepID=A0AAN6WVT1_9PEZI|nr:hypothetical protein QBC35DRAFT_188964 [Podospora australis]